MFLKSLMTPAAELKAQSEYTVPESQQPDFTKSAFIFVMHGIRDYGG